MKILAAIAMSLLLVAQPLRADDGDAADPLTQRMATAIAAGDLSSLRRELDGQVVQCLSNLPQADLQQVISVCSFDEFARYFSAISSLSDQQKQTLTWLAAQARLMPTLMAAVSRADPPADVLQIIAALRAENMGTLDDEADLATALAITWDKPIILGSTGKPPPSATVRAVHLFHYFNSTQLPLRFRPRDLPWQLAVYVVDLRLSEPEMLWAVDHYGHNASPSEAYFDVQYDESYYTQGTAKKLTGQEYTLANILQYGGICVDQAYYASQISKALAVPACVCSGASGAGQDSHAWLGFLQVANRQAQWNFDVARYAEDLFWAGTVVDPQTGARLSDADVKLLAQLQFSPPQARLASALLTKASRLLSPQDRFPLYTQAINLCPGNRAAWMALALNRQYLSDPQRETVAQAIHRLIVNPYPDFAWNMLTMMAVVGDAPAQIAALDHIAAFFPTRPDLRAQIRLCQGDMFHKSANDEQALLAYGDVLTNYLNTGPLVLTAMKRVDGILRDRHETDRLIRIYDEVWRRMPAPKANVHAFWTPYYKLGQEYAKLLDEQGQFAAAADVRTALAKLVPPGVTPPG